MDFGGTKGDSSSNFRWYSSGTAVYWCFTL